MDGKKTFGEAAAEWGRDSEGVFLLFHCVQHVFKVGFLLSFFFVINWDIWVFYFYSPKTGCFGGP